jgi:hypothetical protein
VSQTSNLLETMICLLRTPGLTVRSSPAPSTHMTGSAKAGIERNASTGTSRIVVTAKNLRFEDIALLEGYRYSTTTFQLLYLSKVMEELTSRCEGGTPFQLNVPK